MKALREVLRSISPAPPKPLYTVRQLAGFAGVQPPISIRNLLDICVPDWWMYHHDMEHSGRTSEWAGLTSGNAGDLQLLFQADPLDQLVNIVPSVVGGKIYVGTYNNDTTGSGTFYRIDLYSGSIEASFPIPIVPLNGQMTYAGGVGGSPAIVDGRVYFTNIPGRVYCLDATSFALQWMTDLRAADSGHNQPVRNDNADCFGSPLVVNGKVYLGSGEGEFNAWGFVYCLDAASGDVLWLFCTNQFFIGVDNPPCANSGLRRGHQPAAPWLLYVPRSSAARCVGVVILRIRR